MIKACLNGDRAPDVHPGIPAAPAELAAAAAGAVAAGAGAVHLHPRGPDGRESFHGEDVAAAVRAVRAACPGVPVGVSTRDGVVPSLADKLEQVRDWPRPQAGGPDMASVNWHEEGAAEVATALAQRGIAVEAGLWHPAAVRRWLADDWAERTARVLVEVIPGHASLESTAGAQAILAELPDDQRDVLVHGEQQWAWPVLRWAQARGLDTRIGLEDTLLFEDGTPALDNAALVGWALRGPGAIQSDP